MRPRLDTRELSLVLPACAALAFLILLVGVADSGAHGAARSSAIVHRAWLDGLGITLAGCGTYALARVLGLQWVGAGLATVGYASSGIVLDSLLSGRPLSVAVLPWMLLSIETVRRTAGRLRWWAIVLTTLISAWNLLGAEPGASVCTAICAACWSLALWNRDRRAAFWSAVGLVLGLLCAAPFLAPFVEALRTTDAGVADATRTDGRIDFLSLACWVFLLMTISWWRKSRAEVEAVRAPHFLSPPLMQATTVVVCVVGLAFVLGRRGESPSAALALCPDLFGVPGRIESVAAVISLQSLHAWLPLAVVAAAFVSLLSGTGVLVRRAEIQALAAMFTLVAVHAPGIVDIWRSAPFLSAIAPAHAAGVGALMLALLAGEALLLGDKLTRHSVAVLLLGLSAMSVLRPVQRVDVAAMVNVYGAADPADEIVGWIERPQEAQVSTRAGVIGWVHPALPVERAILRVDRLDARGSPVAEDAREITATWEDAAPASADALPAGARVFRAPELDLTAMRAGVWRFRVELYRHRAGVDEQPMGTRTAALMYIAEVPRLSLSTACMLLAVVIFLCLPRWNGPAALGVVILAAAQALHFANSLRLTM